MGQRHLGQPFGNGASRQFLLLCSKIEQAFLNSACEWLGNQFEAVEVLLVTSFLNSNFFDHSPQDSSEYTVARWVRSCSAGLQIVSHENVDLKPVQGKELSLFPESGAQVVGTVSDTVAIAPDDRFEGSLDEKKLREVKLHLPESDQWPHDSYFLLRGVPSEVVSVINRLSSNPQQEEPDQISTILDRTINELSRSIMKKQKEDESAALYTIISSIPDSVFAKDRSLRYCLINDAFCKLLGRSREEILGKTDEELLQQQYNIDDKVTVDQRVLQGETVRQEKKVEINGVIKSFRNIISPVRNTAGSVIGLCGITHDITDLKEVESQLKQANSFQQAVIRTATEGIGVCIPSHKEPYLRFTIWNDQLKELTGYSLEEINQIDWLDHMLGHRLGREYALSRIGQIIEGNQLKEEEFEFTNKQGERKNILVSSSQVAYGGNQSAIVFLVHDTTARFHIQKSLEESQRRYHLATRNAKISVWEWNILKNSVFDDGNLSRILGYSRQVFSSVAEWMDHIHPDDLQQTKLRYEEFIRGDTDQLFIEKRMKHAKGHWVWIATQGSYISNSDSERIAIGTDLDITSQKETADRIADLQKELLQITRLSAVGEIAASLAHDITQPVTAICNYAAAAKHLLIMPERGNYQATAASYLQKIEQSSKVATNVLKGIRSYINEAEGEYSPQTIGQIVESVLEVAYSDIRHRNIHLNRLSEGCDTWVHVDRAQIVHVIQNIINNAFEALSSVNTRSPVITIKTSSEEDAGVISIEDNGAGFLQKDAQTIFKPFYSTKKGGMGIGLAICKTLIEANSGTITAQGRPGQGAVFVIRLPRCKKGIIPKG